jgi:outer membrane protein OmpA-like peptidoglycan-associated protein
MSPNRRPHPQTEPASSPRRGTVEPRRTGTSVLLAAVACAALAGCETINPYTGEKQISKATIGTGIGAAGGAAVGALAGGRRGALIGAGVGALAGGAVGYYMDRQEAALRQRLQGTGVSVTRKGNVIVLNMPGNVTFGTGSSDVSSSFYPVLDSVSLVVNEFDKTYIDVVGHTDSRGAAAYNQQLSEQRASSVASYLTTREVLPQRIVTRGLGESAPLAGNDTASGRARNRRVEIQLAPLT